MRNMLVFFVYLHMPVGPGAKESMELASSFRETSQ